MGLVTRMHGLCLAVGQGEYYAAAESGEHSPSRLSTPSETVPVATAAAAAAAAGFCHQIAGGS